jgi:hypothetical protein
LSGRKFSELVRILEQDGFTLVRAKGSIRYYWEAWGSPVDSFGLPRSEGSSDRNLQRHFEGGRVERKTVMIDLKYSLVIEATADPNFFGFYSPDLEGFSMRLPGASPNGKAAKWTRLHPPVPRR